MWRLLNTDSYKNLALKAVNLGEDADTVAAVAGGLAGIFYGVENIPQTWLESSHFFYCSQSHILSILILTVNATKLLLKMLLLL